MSKAEKLGSTLERALADPEDEQKNRVVLDIEPESVGFREILPGKIVIGYVHNEL